MIVVSTAAILSVLQGHTSGFACLQVELDLDFNAYANARAHYEKRKQHMVKQQKTVDANEKALKAAEKKAQQQLSQVRSKQAIQHVRKPHWFEKFNWFVTSENYLVISGRDAQQNELIVKRYLRWVLCKHVFMILHTCVSHCHMPAISRERN